MCGVMKQLGSAQSGWCVRQRFRVGDIEPGGSNPPGTQRCEQRLLIDRRASPDVVKDGSRLSDIKAVSVKEIASLGAVRKDIDDMIRFLRPARHSIRSR